MKPRRLVTLGHSYVIAANRRLAHEMTLAGNGTWEVTAVAPRTYRGDLGRVHAQRFDGEANGLETVDARFDRVPHLMWLSGLARIFDAPWDVVHCWQEPYVLAGAQMARQAPPSAKVVMASFQNISKRYPWPISAFERTSMARADGWVAFGRTVRETLSSRDGYTDKPCRIIPPGVDVRRFRPDDEARRDVLAQLGWPPSDPVVGFLGRFVPEKGLPLLIDALRRATVPWRALFVGGGAMRPALDALAADHPGRVHVATGVAHEDVPRWLNAMTVLCAPSQTTARWREQFGRMLIEAMACGVPVAASDSGEIPYVVEDAGVILPEGQAAAWTAAIDRLASDGALRAELRARGLSRVHERFTWSVVARAHLSFFTDLLEGRRA